MNKNNNNNNIYNNKTIKISNIKNDNKLILIILFISSTWTILLNRLRFSSYFLWICTTSKKNSVKKHICWQVVDSPSSTWNGLETEKTGETDGKFQEISKKLENKITHKIENEFKKLRPDFLQSTNHG